MVRRTWVSSYSGSLYCARIERLTYQCTGRHHIRYAILPHAGPLDSRTVRAGYNFNYPMKICSSSSKSGLDDISLSGDPSVVLDTIKRGEDDEDVSRGQLQKRKGRSVILRSLREPGRSGRRFNQDKASCAEGLEM